MGSTIPEQVLVASIAGHGWQGPGDDPQYRALRSSVRASGVLQPLLLRPAGGGFELVSGARRLRAARGTGLLTVPAVILERDHPTEPPPSPAPVVPHALPALPPMVAASAVWDLPDPPQSAAGPTARARHARFGRPWRTGGTLAGFAVGAVVAYHTLGAAAAAPVAGPAVQLPRTGGVSVSHGPAPAAPAATPRPKPPVTAPVGREEHRNRLVGPGIDTAVVPYPDCYGTTAVVRTAAVLVTCSPTRWYIAAHNPGIFTPMMSYRIGDQITYYDGAGVPHTLRVIAIRDGLEATPWVPRVRSDVVAQFQLCETAHPEGGIDRIIDAIEV